MSTKSKQRPQQVEIAKKYKLPVPRPVPSPTKLPAPRPPIQPTEHI